MFASAKIQFCYLMQKKATIVTFCIVVAFILVNFWKNMLTNLQTGYITQMYDITKMLTLSDHSASGYFFLEFLPLLLVIPTACSWLNDKRSQMGTYIQARVGIRNYIYGKAIAVFVLTFLIFTVPFLLEIIMSAMGFSLKSFGDPAWQRYEEIIAHNGDMLWGNIYLKHRFLYAVIWILVFGTVCGILALFNVAISMLRFMKYKVYAFFPIYLLICLLGVIERLWDPNFTLEYLFILRMFQSTQKNYPLYTGFLAALLIISIIIMEKMIHQKEGLLHER